MAVNPSKHRHAFGSEFKDLGGGPKHTCNLEIFELNHRINQKQIK